MEENNNNYSYWKDLLKENDCAKCHQQIIFPEKDFKEDSEYHPNVYVLKEGIFHNDCVNWLENSIQGKAIYDTETKEFKNWETILKKYPCFSCNYDFTDQDLNRLRPVYEKEEIHYIKHLDCLGCCWCQLCQEVHKEIKEKGVDNTCFAKNCKNQLGNLVIYDSNDTPNYPKCIKEDFWKFHNHPQISEIKIKKNKITVFLGDEREISLPVNELVKRWKKPNLKVEQLKKYEIDPWGFRLHFPDADVDTSVLIFTGDNCGCC